MMDETALILGTGPGLGLAIARRCARGGMKVAIAARDTNRLEEYLPELREAGAPEAGAYGCDVASENFVNEAFREVIEELGAPRLVVFNAGTFVRKSIEETTADEFEQCWRVGCMGGFLAGRAAIHAMEGAGPREDGSLGTIIFTGATASLRGGAQFHNLAVGKFGLRALAQSMAREYGPKGVHVAHSIIDGQIRAEHRGPEYTEAGRGEDALLHPEAIAEAYWNVHCQPRNAWTHEFDLRPWVEKF
ncbi:MAG: SDR family NAD(P)-dependent oxidoreductase [Halofilum sp. (in: g-proteobacteria)]|nr:SDR family NAD(P)-dependent oxidoreductase [Halofilum sp. (in: g-proteobacteria)]